MNQLEIFLLLLATNPYVLALLIAVAIMSGWIISYYWPVSNRMFIFKGGRVLSLMQVKDEGKFLSANEGVGKNRKELKWAKTSDAFTWKRGFRIYRCWFAKQGDPYTTDLSEAPNTLSFDETSFSASDDAAFLSGLQKAIKKRVWDFVLYFCFGLSVGALLIHALYLSGVYRAVGV